MTDYSTDFFPRSVSTNTLGPSITAHLGQEGVIIFSVMNNQSTELIANNLHKTENFGYF